MKRAAARLAATAGVRQVQAVERADQVADTADAAVSRLWRAVLTLLRAGVPSGTAHPHARLLFAQLIPTVANATATSLHRLARWGWQQAARNLVTHLPTKVLAHAAIRQVRPLREAVEPIDWTDLLFPFRNPGSSIADADWLSLLFPSPSEAQVQRTVYASGWVERLAAATSLGQPEQLASILSTGLLLGRSQQEIARALLPAVEGVRTTARRIARTEGLRVAGAAQMGCYDQLGDLVVGYSVIATMDSHVRPWHALRNGHVYYIRPKPGEKGLDQMPHPPEEPLDPRERPAGTPATAYNCRCALVPVLADPGQATRDELDALGPAPLPAHEIYADWWSTATPAQKRIAVGVRRYHAARDILGHEPEWSHFVDPDDGALVPLSQLRDEEHHERLSRVQRVRQQLAQNRASLAHTRNYGSVPGRW